MGWQEEWFQTAVRLVAAAVCGGVIGFNRERKHRPAGLRTLMLVAMGAAAFSLMGDQICQDIQDKTAMGRIVAGLVGGIGFLGAGTIIQSRGSIVGVTTAASVWAAAGLGAACGLGYYAIPVLGVVLSMLILWLGPAEKMAFGKEERGGEGGELIEKERDQAMRQSRHQAP